MGFIIDQSSKFPNKCALRPIVIFNLKDNGYKLEKIDNDESISYNLKKN